MHSAKGEPDLQEDSECHRVAESPCAKQLAAAATRPMTHPPPTASRVIVHPPPPANPASCCWRQATPPPPPPPPPQTPPLFSASNLPPPPPDFLYSVVVQRLIEIAHSRYRESATDRRGDLNRIAPTANQLGAEGRGSPPGLLGTPALGIDHQNRGRAEPPNACTLLRRPTQP